MNPEFLHDIRRAVGFRSEHADLLRALRPAFEPHLEAFATAFYESIERDAEARRYIHDAEQRDRLKGTLKEWARSLLEGGDAPGYLERRARIGRIHVQIGLPQKFMFMAMGVVRAFLLEKLVYAAGRPAEWVAAHAIALDRAVDAELAVMLETYHEELEDKLTRNERLATLGLIAGTVNHELKNPLAVIATSIHALRRRLEGPDGGFSDERVGRHLEKIERNVNRMTRTMSALLEYARHREPVIVETAVDAFIHEALDAARPPAGIAVVEEPRAPGLALIADRDQVLVVLRNLLANAYDALGGGPGTVRIGVETLAFGVRVSIEDSGPGIPDDYRETIFEPLWSGRRDGTGLGLAISRAIARAHRGRLRAVSPRHGGGARFELDLPIPGGAL